MVCVALAVPAAVFFPFSLPGMPFDIGVSARISAGFPFCLLCVFCRLSRCFSTGFLCCLMQRRPVPFSRNSDSCRRAFLLCIPRLVRCIVYRRALLVTGQPAVLSLSPLIYCDVFSFPKTLPSFLLVDRRRIHLIKFLPHICGRTALSTLLSRYSIKFSQGEARLSHT